MTKIRAGCRERQAVDCRCGEDDVELAEEVLTSDLNLRIL